MRMSLLIFLLTNTMIYGFASHSVAQRVTLERQNASLRSVILEIRQQTGYDFLINKQLYKRAKPISIRVNDAPLEEALAQCLAGQNLSFSIHLDNRTILIKEKTEPTVKKVHLLQDTIRGTVTDSLGRPLAGVAVRIENTRIATTSNAQGRFILPQSIDNGVLVFQLLGYAPYKEVADQNNSMQITLHESISFLDETVVIGYGTSTRRLNTGNVAKVSGETIRQQPVSNPIAALAGRVPGLEITQVNGLPGSGFNVQLRGRNSIQQGTTPLYVIDGVPFDASNLTQAVSLGQLNVNNPFNTINPGDIESIEVLKDADATSIYGSRAANGVILITTKRSTAGAFNVNFNSYIGRGKVVGTAKMLNGEQYRQLRREAFANDGIEPNVNNAYELILFDTTIVNDWRQQLIGETANSTNMQLSVSGGNSLISYVVGANYYNEGTVFPGQQSVNRQSTNASINYTSPSKNLILSFSSSYSNNNSSLIYSDLTQYLNKPPYGAELIDGNGNLIWEDAAEYYGNPLSYTKQDYIGITDMLYTSSAISYKPFSELTLKVNGGFNLLDFDEKLLRPTSSFNPAHNIYGSAQFGHNKVRNWSIEPQIEYNKSIATHGKIAVLVGGSWQENEGRKDIISGSGYTNGALINSIAAATSIVASNDYNLYRYSALFGRLSFNWKDSYILNFNGRRDGSSRFGPSNQFANFGSIGLAWLFTNLNLFQNNFKTLNYGKVRLSYGTSGNDQIGNYRYLDTYSVLSEGYQQSLSLDPTRLYNSNYSWEQFSKIEAAIELGFLNDRVYFSTVFYRNKSANQLINYSLPNQTGFGNIMLNFPGVVENKGWEIELRSDNIQKNSFRWTTSFNISIPRNRLLAFPELESSSYSNTYEIGQPLNVFRGYKFLGVDSATGIYKVLDVNEDGFYDTTDYLSLGTTDPKYFGGLQNSISWKSFTFDFLLQFIKQMGRHPIYSDSSPIGGDGNKLTNVLDYWRQPGDIVPYAKPTTQTWGTELYESYTLTAMSDAVLTDASFIRLKNASISYSIPNRVSNILRINGASVYLQGQNLLTISRFLGLDPEVQSPYILPPIQMWTVGFRITI